MAYAVSTVSVAFMAIAIVFGVNHPTIATICYVSELIALCSLFLMIHTAKKAHVHNNWLQNRALAERIRTTFFFISSGLKPGPLEEIEHEAGWNDWVTRVISEIRDGIELPDVPYGFETVRSFDQFVRTMWLRDQIAYHSKKSTEATKDNARLKNLGITLFASAIIVSAVHLALSLFGAAGHKPGRLMLLIENTLTVIAVALPAAAAAVGGYRILMEHSRIAARSASMVKRLKQLDARTPEPASMNDLEKLLVQAESIMLEESRDWMSLMSHADLERIA